MSASFVNPADPIDRQNEKLLKIVAVLVRRVEQATDHHGEAYQHFQRSLMLEEQVRARTRDLEQSFDLLNQSNLRLSEATATAEQARAGLFDALEAVQEGFALFDPDDVLVMCNSRFALHLPDVKPAVAPGLRFRDYVGLASRSRYLALPAGETAAAWADRRRRRHADNHVNFTVRVRDDRGTARWIQVSEHRTPSRGTAVVQTDVTDMVQLERRERERLLDDQARLMRATLDHINQGICIVDRTHRLVWWNRRLRELLDPPVDALQVGRSVDRLCRYFAAALCMADGDPVSAIADWVARTGSRPPLTLEARLGGSTHLSLFAQEMPDRGFMISVTDISAERAAMRAVRAANQSLERRVLDRTLALQDALDEAERANASKSRFVAAASHDLLQPLSAAKLFLASLQGMAPGGTTGGMTGAAAAQIVQRAQNALNGVEAILGSLLDISKLDSGRAAVSVEPVAMNRILRPLRDEFEPLARQQGLALRIIDCGTPVDSDPAYLRRILQNLIGNAIRYTERGRVLVGARRRGAALRLEVWDTGPGIAAEDQHVIFQEFQRLGDSRDMVDGVGLGLAIVERACALLGHPLSLCSEPGRGTGFFVTVPLSMADPAVAPPCRPAPAPAAGGGRLDLVALVVENEPGLRRALSILLESWGVSVFDAPGHAEALALMAAIDGDVVPDILLADYQLEAGCTGLDTITALRKLYPTLPAVMITANRAPELRQRCARSGVGFLNKPVEPAVLHDLLRRRALELPPTGFR